MATAREVYNAYEQAFMTTFGIHLIAFWNDETGFNAGNFAAWVCGPGASIVTDEVERRWGKEGVELYDNLRYMRLSDTPE